MLVVAYIRADAGKGRYVECVDGGKPGVEADLEMSAEER